MLIERDIELFSKRVSAVQSSVQEVGNFRKEDSIISGWLIL